jgi:hypothetical protein
MLYHDFANLILSLKRLIWKLKKPDSEWNKKAIKNLA